MVGVLALDLERGKEDSNVHMHLNMYAGTRLGSSQAKKKTSVNGKV